MSRSSGQRPPVVVERPLLPGSAGSLTDGCRLVFECAEAVLRELGAGFSEQILQAALAVELGARGIAYLREPHLEVYYRGVCVGLDRPDFVLWLERGKHGLEGAMLLELKQAERILAEYRQQVIAYLAAVPQSRDPRLACISTAILLRFPRADHFDAWEGLTPTGIELEVWCRDRVTGAVTREAMLPAP